MTDPINPSARSLTGSISNGANRTPSKVNTEGGAAGSPANTPTSTPANTPASSAPTSPGSVDTVSLSAGSQQVIELQQQLKTAAEIDAAKIDAIREEIANGNYPLDAQKIAENFINLEQSLIE